MKEKIKLSWKEEILQKLKMERVLSDWAVNLQRKLRKGRFNKLKKLENKSL